MARNRNFETFRIRMAFGITSSDFEPRLYNKLAKAFYYLLTIYKAIFAFFTEVLFENTCFFIKF